MTIDNETAARMATNNFLYAVFDVDADNVLLCGSDDDGTYNWFVNLGDLHLTTDEIAVLRRVSEKIQAKQNDGKDKLGAEYLAYFDSKSGKQV